uniref:Uncharacterized protein n=1 Tax=Rhizophora mucronata TaxID=61149 RepID=A0A2P2NYM5_RHIMU
MTSEEVSNKETVFFFKKTENC